MLVLLAIAVAGAGMAFAASTVLFSPSSDRSEIVPEGLIDELATDEPDATPKATKKPKKDATPDVAGGSTGGGGGSAPAAAAPEEDGPRSPAGTSQTVQSGVFVEDTPEGECDDEDNDADRERCEDELEADADEAEDEAEEEADEDEEDDDDD